MPEHNNRYTDKGDPQNVSVDTVGALKRKLEQGDKFQPRSTDTEQFKNAVISAADQFSLKASSVAPEVLIPKTNLDVDSRRFIENLASGEYGYNLALNQLTDGGLYNPDKEAIKVPTQDQILSVLLGEGPNAFSKQELEAIRKHAEQEKGFPGLVICPEDLPFLQRFVSHLNAGTRNKQDVSVSENRQKEFTRQDKALNIDHENPDIAKITGWKAGIVNIGKELRNHRGCLEQDIINPWLNSDEAKLLQLVDQKLYCLLQKGSLLSGNKEPMDKEGWSPLQPIDGSPIVSKDSCVSGGSCDWDASGVPRVYFYEFFAGGRYYCVHLHSAKMKKIV